jgi:hypothetical protein
MSRLSGDEYVDGTLSAKKMNIPDSTVVDADIAANAAIATTKMKHLYEERYSQPNTTATSETREFHTVFGATATLKDFRAGLIGANVGAATVTVDLKKNGVSVLTGVITLDNAVAALAEVAGTIASAAGAAGDTYTIVITATAGGGTLGTGFYCQAIFEEDPQ